jgi:hypothetical protein
MNLKCRRVGFIGLKFAFSTTVVEAHARLRPFRFPRSIFNRLLAPWLFLRRDRAETSQASCSQAKAARFSHA